MSGESTWLRGRDVESLAGGAQESGESSRLGGGDVEFQVRADRKRTRWRGSKVVQELQIRMSEEVEVGGPKSLRPFGYL